MQSLLIDEQMVIGCDNLLLSKQWKIQQKAGIIDWKPTKKPFLIYQVTKYYIPSHKVEQEERGNKE